MVTVARRQVRQEAVDEAIAVFTDRLQDRVSIMMNNGRELAAWGWVTEMILGYVGARSVSDPRFLSRDMGVALRSAAETAVGEVEIAWRPEAERFDVFVSFVGQGVVYEWNDDERVPATRRGAVPIATWLDAFRLYVLCLRDDVRMAETMSHSLAALPDPATLVPGPERAALALAWAMEELSWPQPDHDRIAHALAHADGAQGPLATQIAAVRALVAEDGTAFNARLEELVTLHRRQASEKDPAGLLDLRSLALAWLAHGQGVQIEVESDYLPKRLFTGEWQQPPGRRAEPFGVRLASLPEGGLEVRRNPVDRGGTVYDEHFRKVAGYPFEHEQAGLLKMVVTYQHRRLCDRAMLDSQGQDARQWYALALIARAGAGAARAEAMTADVTFDFKLGSLRGPLHGSGGRSLLKYRERVWAISAALAARDSAALAELGRGDEDRLAAEAPRACDSWYVRALLRFIRGDDPREAIQRGLAEADHLPPNSPEADFVNGRVVPPLVLLSQLVAGDAEAFALSLADGLEAWRDHYSLPHHADDPDQLVALTLLGIAAAAHDRGWEIPVTSDYVPRRLLEGAWVGTPIDLDAPTEEEVPSPHPGPPA
ncbi:immunity 49 family protein [Streptomyces smyrnaeus]|uniref:immunity 49 family protein n=1 Tax=Streptomyces smyrnaeus TaxID=1387713 RepID=UPI0037A87A4D